MDIAKRIYSNLSKEPSGGSHWVLLCVLITGQARLVPLFLSGFLMFFLYLVVAHRFDGA